MKVPSGFLFLLLTISQMSVAWASPPAEKGYLIAADGCEIVVGIARVDRLRLGKLSTPNSGIDRPVTIAV